MKIAIRAEEDREWVTIEWVEYEIDMQQYSLDVLISDVTKWKETEEIARIKTLYAR